jgi:UDPglucose 6-dehydrogenase
VSLTEAEVHANEMAELAGRLGVSWEPVRQALVLDPRIGDGHLRVPGPDGQRGFGGSCLPKDMAALVALGAEVDVALPVVEAALVANHGRRAGDG